MKKQREHALVNISLVLKDVIESNALNICFPAGGPPRTPPQNYFSWKSKTIQNPWVEVIRWMTNSPYLRGSMSAHTIISFTSYQEWHIENTSCKIRAFGIYARVLEIERVRFLMQKQRVRRHCTKHFPCSIVFITYNWDFLFTTLP